MLSSDRTLSLVVAIETALEDRRYEASPLSCSTGLATVLAAAAVLRLLLCKPGLLAWAGSTALPGLLTGLPGPPRACTDVPAPTCTYI